MSKLRKKYLIIWIILSIVLLMGFTNTDLPFDKEDQKKLEKAQSLNIEAQEIYDKADLLYSEIADLDISNPKNEKKANSLKEKALDYQIKALELQKEANYLEYNVLNSIKPELKSNYQKSQKIPLKVNLLEESADELYYKAEQLRNDAYSLDKDEKERRFAILDEAQKFEKEGLDKQKQVIDIYLGKTLIEDDSQGTIAKAENIEINQDLLNAYMDFMEEEEESQTPMESFKELVSSDSLSSTSFRDAWEVVIYAEPEAIETTDLEKDPTSEIISKELAEQYDDPKENVSETGVGEKKELNEKNIIYKIQIAVDKKPLSQHVLSKMYAGNKNIKIVNEDGWHKYTIGDFNTFLEADEYRKKIGVSQAFVVSYEDEVKVDLLAENKEQKITKKNDKVNPNLPNGLIFKIQIAADSKMMSEELLKNLYQGTEQIDLIEEGGWYKYSVGKLNTYEKAASLKKTIDAKGCFIVAYNNGVKVPLQAAKSGKVSKPINNENVVFKVQIAADTKSISSDNLHKIYSGYENVQHYEEDGMHKYSLGEFNTYEEANKFRANSGVKGAFVIAFQGEKKMNVLEAKRMKRCYDPIIISDWLSSNNQLTYKIQIAASSKKLTVNQIKNICCIESNVYLTEEDNWFKYSIGKFEKYEDAVKMKEKSGVKGAFIVVYKNDKKLGLTEARKLSK